jgi:RNA polymerase sigma-54 factor
MALTPRLDLRQTQSLVMTPQLQQAIKLLQLSSIELSAYVDTQLQENPLLEREDGDGAAVADEPADTDAVAGTADDPVSVDRAVGAESLEFADHTLDSDVLDNLFERDSVGDVSADGPLLATLVGTRGGSFEDQDGGFAETLAGRPTLREHLAGQAAVDLADPVDRIIAMHLIDLVDEAGYLTDDLDEQAALLGCARDRLERVLSRLQRFDPPGVFARNLAECLTLQLLDRGRLDVAMRRLIGHLDLVGQRDWPALCRLCAVDSATLAAMVAEIRTLNPKPALVFDEAIAQPITPDIIVRRQTDGGWAVELNGETLPRLLVNNRYYAHVSRSTRTKADRQYINECLQSANWLVKSLHQRATTILKVATEIVRRQERFLAEGVQSLRPLILRDVAEAVGMHESTVSRVTSNKFMATPRGIFELKYFFTHAVGGGSGEAQHSAEAVRHRIRGLIDGEKPENVLSDDALVELLRRDGIEIARRTAAKYREAMGIPSSVLRRRQKTGLPWSTRLERS